MVDERNRDLLNEFYFVLFKVLTNLPLYGEIIFLRFVFCTGKLANAEVHGEVIFR